jgi:hypothetical protein
MKASRGQLFDLVASQAENKKTLAEAWHNQPPHFHRLNRFTIRNISHDLVS